MRNNSQVRQQMLEMVNRWKQSGLSQKDFCEKEPVTFHKFYYWYRRSGQQDKPIPTQETPGFVKLKIEEPLVATSIEIHFPQGARLFFHNPVSAEYLKTLLT
jgi:hypothetical protein